MTPEDLRKLIAYDPETGALTWKARGNKRQDTMVAGKPALNSLCRGYRVGTILRTPMKAHRAAWAIHYGEWPEGQIDHINGNKSDNRIENLRDVDNATNGKNQRRRPNNKTGEQCINWFARDKKWWVKITVDGKQKHIGYFDTMEDAIAARDAAYERFGFHENHGR